MQYFKPDGPYFVGDCMPFFHDGTFHLYYLLDEGHHQGKGGLGGHRWAHASTTDLVRWTHHPLAVPITLDWEASICTGSVFWHNGVYHAFYAARLNDRTERLSHAVSRDGITFHKCEPNPFLPVPAGYGPRDCRDPFVFADEAGGFHMLVTSRIAEYPLHDCGGCLVRLTSEDLEHWRLEGTFLVPGGAGYGSIPECPDLFHWDGWYYVLFGQGLTTRYRMSRHPFGPWQRPAVDVLDCPLTSVMKTAPFGPDRRIGVAWVGSREADKDAGRLLWGGNVFFREILQQEDGTLSTRFVPEMMPAAGEPVDAEFAALTDAARRNGSQIELEAGLTPQVGCLRDVPADYRLGCRVEVCGEGARFGLGLRGSGRYEKKYELAFDPGLRRVSLGGVCIEGVSGLDEPFDLDVIVRDSIIDTCIAGRRCVINRCCELRGNDLFFSCENGKARFQGVEVRAVRSQ